MSRIYSTPPVCAPTSPHSGELRIDSENQTGYSEANLMSLCTVFLADDYEPFRRILHSMLEEIPGIEIVGHAADGLEAIQRATELQPDLILLDIGLPKLNGMQVA